jgi:hypothetical protein
LRATGLVRILAEPSGAESARCDSLHLPTPRASAPHGVARGLGTIAARILEGWRQQAATEAFSALARFGNGFPRGLEVVTERLDGMLAGLRMTRQVAFFAATIAQR